MTLLFSLMSTAYSILHASPRAFFGGCLMGVVALLIEWASALPAFYTAIVCVLVETMRVLRQVVAFYLSPNQMPCDSTVRMILPWTTLAWLAAYACGCVGIVCILS
ncbi:hypothetical protein ml_120 [Mollivirus sibericum]|uniref:hypothetical protein n=1 Tax=Mollivirus sibericum TaxID=1678078 RepID=UPI0006B2E2C5|nr:hypothetical protein ml_120 [Mollivirus sibericum]ALD61922.1 hypothetical protein ml_120 [Mollivirus sibericum]